MRRISYVAIAALVALTGCTAHPTLNTAPPSTPAAAPEPSGSPIAGGCGGTSVWAGSPPAWTASAGGIGPIPFVVSHEGNLVGALFANPLRGGPGMTNPYNKILWIARESRQGTPLRLTLRRVDGTGPAVAQQEPADSFPGEIYPSIVDVPTAGCWAVTAEWAGHRATLELAYV